jgi:hypothetical protein
MNRKRITIFIVVLALLGITAGAVSAQQGDGGRRGNQFGQPGERGGRMRDGIGLVQIVADELGISPRDVAEQMRGGVSLAEVITNNGGSIENVTAAAIEQATERISLAVENGRITQEQADEMLANLETHITDMLNANPAARLDHLLIVERVAGETGLTLRDVTQQWRDGVTLGEILTANGEDVQAFIDETLTRAQERFDQAVANGRLTQQQADQRLEELRTSLPDFLNQAFPEDLFPLRDGMPRRTQGI